MSTQDYAKIGLHQNAFLLWKWFQFILFISWFQDLEKDSTTPVDYGKMNKEMDDTIMGTMQSGNISEYFNNDLNYSFLLF